MGKNKKALQRGKASEICDIKVRSATEFLMHRHTVAHHHSFDVLFLNGLMLRSLFHFIFFS
ncbi:MAG TPA: hypothetical protein DEO71_11335 [Chryseobacterium sp.]|nr:hypothetical protein [Chryseobacterium sp.]